MKTLTLFQYIVSVALLFGLLLIDGRLGPLSASLSSFLAAMALLVGLCRCSPRQPATWAAGLLWVALVCNRLPYLGVWFYLTIVLLIAESCRRSATESMPDFVPSAMLTYASCGLLCELVPQSSGVLNSLSHATSRYASYFAGDQHVLGPHALGLPVAGLAFLLLIDLGLRQRSRRTIGLAISIGLLYLGLTPFFLPKAMTVSRGSYQAFIPGAIAGTTCLAISLGAGLFLASRRDKEPHSSPPKRSVLVLLAAIGGIAGVVLAGTTALVSPKPAKITVFNRGGLDWERPSYQNSNNGMFGQLPLYAQGNGFKFELLDNDVVSSSDLADTQILTLVNLPKKWAGEEKQAILDFVSGGGSLLVLGDHTDVFGLMDGFNPLLSDFGMAFKFDSAYPARKTWAQCTTCSNDAVIWNWRGESQGIGIGASLELSGNARPLLMGRYGHSDRGVRENIIGSFLGNYVYETGEQLGDVPLVAVAPYGAGRVVVFGDTSTFQGSLGDSWNQPIGPLLEYLRRPSGLTERPWLRRGAAFLFLFAILAGLKIASLQPQLSMVAGFLTAGVTMWLFTIPAVASPFRVAEDTLLVDSSHLPATGHYEIGVNSVGPLWSGGIKAGLRVKTLGSSEKFVANCLS